MKDQRPEDSLRFDAEVRCLDGRCARLKRVVLEPRTASVTHLVLRLGDGRDVVMPMTMVGRVNPDGILLKVGADELRELPDFLETDFCLPSSDLSLPYGEGCAVMPLPDLGVYNPGPLPVEHQQIPPGEIALTEGTPVHCADGACGHVDKVLLDPAHSRTTGFVVRKGFFFTRDVTVPLSWVSTVDAEGVHLKATRDQLTKLERNWP